MMSCLLLQGIKILLLLLFKQEISRELRQYMGLQSRGEEEGEDEEDAEEGEEGKVEEGGRRRTREREKRGKREGEK